MGICATRLALLLAKQGKFLLLISTITAFRSLAYFFCAFDVVLQVFDVNGKFLRKFGSEGSGHGRFQNPYGIALDPAGNVFVGEYSYSNSNHRVQIFKSDGTFITTFGSQGGADGQFNTVFSVCVSRDGRICVGDRNTHVQVFGFSTWCCCVDHALFCAHVAHLFADLDQFSPPICRVSFVSSNLSKNKPCLELHSNNRWFALHSKLCHLHLKPFAARS